MRGLPRTAQFVIRFLGCSLVVSILPSLLFSADAASPPPSGPVVHSDAPQARDQEPAAVAELLSLIEQLDPLRVTVPYIDYHDEAVAAQTSLQRRRRRAGLDKRGRSSKTYDARKGWSERSISSRTRGLSSRR